MGRKHKKGNFRKQMPTPGDGDMESAAMKALAEGKFRKARDAFKVLCKQDREKYLPRLIEANLGLAREMLVRGQVQEARQVLDYLKSIAPESSVRALELEAARAGGTFSSDPSRICLTLHLERNHMSEEEILMLADQAVLGFERPAPENPVAVELSHVLDALEAVADRRYDEARPSLRALPFHSAFNHWKLWIKGVAAYHQGESGKALQCLQKIPDGTVSHRAAGLYRWLIEGAPRPDARALGGGCAMLGLPTQIAPALLEAEDSWCGGDPVLAYQKLRLAWKEFPVLGNDLAGCLSEFFFKSIFRLDQDAMDEYAHCFFQMERHGRYRGDAERMWVLWIICRLLDEWDENSQLKEKFRQYIRLLNRCHGPNPQRDSLAFIWLAERLSEEKLPTTIFGWAMFGCPEAWDPEGAKDAYEKSIEIDPDNLEAYLGYCKLLEESNELSVRNRLLDTMSRRFPDRKEVLLRAGLLCLERKALNKGLGYLERVYEQDRLDPAVSRGLIEGYLQLARRHAEKGRLEEARKSWIKAEAKTVDSWQDCTRNRWCLRLQQSILEGVYGDKQTSQRLAREAEAGFPCRTSYLWFVHLAFTELFRKEEKFHGDQYRREAFEGARAARAGLMLRILFYWAPKKNRTPLRVESHYRDFENYLRFALRQPFDRHDVVHLERELSSHPRFAEWPVQFAERLLAQDPQEPMMRILQLEARAKNGPPCHPRLMRDQAAAIQTEARQRRDTEALQRVADLLKRLPPDTAYDPTPSDDLSLPDDAFGVEEDEAEVPDFHADSEIFIDTILDLLADIPEDSLEEFKAANMPNVPDSLFNLIVAVAKGQKPAQGIKSLFESKAGCQNDPNQPDLFDLP